MLLAVIGFGAGPPFVTLALKEFYIIDFISSKIFYCFFINGNFLSYNES
jgi:hypothetical protein